VLKRDRSSEEKHADKLAKTGMMLLGGTNPTPAEPTPFPFYLYWDKLGRKGQRCQVQRLTTRTVRVRFEDGFESVLNRSAIRRISKP
jgi:hypothetical protein